jgi:Cd2+/Zn2+-exporting ATPase
MDCTNCAATLEKSICQLNGVQSARVDFSTAKLHLEGDVSLETLRQRAEPLGYHLTEEVPIRSAPALKRGGVRGFWDYLIARRDTQLALLGGAIILLTIMGSLIGLSAAPQQMLYVVAMVIAAYPIARKGIVTLLTNRDFNINLLMTIAAVGAVLIGETAEGATVIFFFAVGEALEGYTADRARDSLRSLMTLAPAQAIRLKDERQETVPVEALHIDDVIVIRPGERIAMDGVVVAGSSDVNQAPITGESIPVHKAVGAETFAGTINVGGLLQVRVTRLVADNTLSRIIRLVEQAQEQRAPSQRTIDSFARVYTPAVVVIAAFVAFIPPLLFNSPFYDLPDGTHGWLYRALAMLVIACPCALVISAPVTVISAITAAARRGVLIKGGVHLETLGRIRAFAFDKTGTLTRGQPVLTNVRAIDCVTGVDCDLCDDVLALASAVEQRSTHPLARAVIEAAQQRGLNSAYPLPESGGVLAGRGVTGVINGKTVTVGNHSLFDAEHPHDQKLCAMVDAAEAQGRTAMLVCDGDRVRGFLAVADEVRSDSRDVIADLKTLDCTTVMLTGDNAIVAQAVGREVGINAVRSGLLPADKVMAVKDLLTEHKQVAMVGDGVNDTPALATATVGIAMGGAGSAQALETADVVLMADDLRQLPFAVRLSRFVRGLIWQNIALSLATKLIFLALAVFGTPSLWLAILADVGMSLLVTLNGMRPLRFE